MNTVTTIRFKPVTLQSVPEISRLLAYARSRTCDYTVAGLLMWADYFHYEYAVVDETLFIKGVTENDVTRPAFSMPIGKMPLGESLSLVTDYCHAHGQPIIFSAVPEDRLSDFYLLGPCEIEELTDWADYLYDAGELSTITGNRYSKKRNHVNRFETEHPGYVVEKLVPELISEVKEFFRSIHLVSDNKDVTAEVERVQAFGVLDNYERLPFEGMVLRTPQDGIVAFAVGEIIGDTLFVHIEKMNHAINGAGETINKFFASAMREKYGITYINREEDVGDEGLRKAKMSYHPVMLLKKYNLTVDK